MSEFHERLATLIVEVDIDDPSYWPATWSPGPYGFRHGSMVADATSRGTYFASRACRALYGTSTEPRRWSRPAHDADRGDACPVGFVPDVVEALRFAARGEPDGLLIVHGRIDPGHAPAEVLRNAAHLSGSLAGADDGASLRSWYDMLLSAGDGRAGRVRTVTKRASTLAFFTPLEPLDKPFSGDRYDDWTAEEQWLWLLASATPYADYPPDPEGREDLVGRRLRLSDDWHVLVLRDGAAFLGRREDTTQSSDFYRSAAFYFRSIYVDAFLLGMVQRTTLSALADSLAGLADPIRRPEKLEMIQREAAEFRNIYWWQSLTPHGHVNDVLERYSEQHRLEMMATQVFDEIDAYTRHAQTLAQDRTNGLLGILALVGGPVGIALGVCQALDKSSFEFVGVALGLAVFASALLLVLLGRGLLTSLRRAPHSTAG